MANFNKVILAGNLTRDPQLSYTPSQTAVCEFGMAINRKWKDTNEVCFVDCQAWGKTGEIINQHMSKGRPLLVDGRLTFDAWEGKDGKKHSRLRVTVENFQFLGSPDEQQAPRIGHQQPGPPMGAAQPPAPQASYQAPPTPGSYGPPNTQHQPPPATAPPNTNAEYEKAQASGGDTSIPF